MENELLSDLSSQGEGLGEQGVGLGARGRGVVNEGTSRKGSREGGSGGEEKKTTVVLLRKHRNADALRKKRPAFKRAHLYDRGDLS